MCTYRIIGIESEALGDIVRLVPRAAETPVHRATAFAIEGRPAAAPGDRRIVRIAQAVGQLGHHHARGRCRASDAPLRSQVDVIVGIECDAVGGITALALPDTDRARQGSLLVLDHEAELLPARGDARIAVHRQPTDLPAKRQDEIRLSHG